jgi:hypothetical protein
VERLVKGNFSLSTVDVRKDLLYVHVDECELRGMTPERIYLLARMGNTRAALSLIIRELADIEQAVAFCKGFFSNIFLGDFFIFLF